MPPKKQIPFSKDDYFKQLEDMLKMPSPNPTSANPLMDRLRRAGQRISSTALAGTAL